MNMHPCLPCMTALHVDCSSENLSALFGCCGQVLPCVPLDCAWVGLVSNMQDLIFHCALTRHPPCLAPYPARSRDSGRTLLLCHCLTGRRAPVPLLHSWGPVAMRQACSCGHLHALHHSCNSAVLHLASRGAAHKLARAGVAEQHCCCTIVPMWWQQEWGRCHSPSLRSQQQYVSMYAYVSSGRLGFCGHGSSMYDRGCSVIVGQPRSLARLHRSAAPASESRTLHDIGSCYMSVGGPSRCRMRRTGAVHPSARCAAVYVLRMVQTQSGWCKRGLAG